MNTATIAIPKRWEPAMGEIKRFVEEYAQLHKARFTVVLTYQLDAGQIYLIDDTLTEFERQVCENAIHSLSDQLNANLSKDPWQAVQDVIAALQREIQRIEELIDREIPPETKPGAGANRHPAQPVSGRSPGLQGTFLSDLITDEQINLFLRSFCNTKERGEAPVFTEWLLTNDLARLVAPEDMPVVNRGGDPPDFVVSGRNKKTIAVEVSTFVTEKKKILDKSPAFPGGYTSSLRRGKADAAFHAAIKGKHLPDDSGIHPHFENTADLDRDYYETMKPVLSKKVADAKQYAGMFDHTVILIEDSLSEFETTMERRLPELRSYLQSIQLSASVEVVLISVGKRRSGKAYRL